MTPAREICVDGGRQGKYCKCLHWLPELSSLVLTLTFFFNPIKTLILVVLEPRYNVYVWVERLSTWHTKIKENASCLLK